MKIIKFVLFSLLASVLFPFLYPALLKPQLAVVNASTFKPAPDSQATITHIRPNGFFQKCNIVDNRHVICTLTNRRNGKTLCNGFTLNFNNECATPANPAEVDSKTVLINELLNAAQRGDLEIGPFTTPLTHNIIQKLLLSTKVKLATAQLEPDLDNLLWEPTSGELIIGTKFLKKFTDQTLIFTLGHEIAHGTQKSNEYSCETIDNIVNRTALITPLVAFMANIFSTDQKITNPFTLSAITLFTAAMLLNRYKFAFHVYRRSNPEINADLLSLAISETIYQYPLMAKNGDTNWQGMSDDSHPTLTFRTAYIQEFIQKYHELQAWFADNQKLIEE
jgi:hypothetical protein